MYGETDTSLQVQSVPQLLLIWLCQSGSLFMLITAGLQQKGQAQELKPLKPW